MQDRTIDNALLALRKQIILEQRDDLEHVEALLQARGVDMPRVIDGPAKRGEAQRIVLAGLRASPMRMPEVAAHMAAQRQHLTPQAAYKRAGLALAKLKARGLVRHEGRVWATIKNKERQ